MTNITIDTVVAPDLDITDLTTIDLKGTGVWDKLLQTMRVQLNDQFEKNRITGPTYGQTYAATYDSTLQAAISFLLAKERQALEFKQLELQGDLTQAQIDQIHDQMTAGLGRHRDRTIRVDPGDHVVGREITEPGGVHVRRRRTR